MALFDTASSGFPGDGAGTLTWQHTCNGSDRFLLVYAQFANVDATLGATYGGVPMEEVWYPGVNVRAFGLVNPPAGDNAVVLTAPGTTSDMMGVAVSYTGVDQATPYDGLAVQTDGGGAPSVVVASAPGNLVVGGMAWGNDFGATIEPITAGPGQTERVERVSTGGASDIGLEISDEPGGASVTHSYTTNAEPFYGSWAFAFNLRASGLAEIVIELDAVSAQAAPVAFPHTSALDIVAGAGAVIDLTILAPGEIVVALPVLAATAAPQALDTAHGLDVVTASATVRVLLLSTSVGLQPIGASAAAQPLVVGDILPIVAASAAPQPVAWTWPQRPAQARATVAALTIVGAAQTIEEVFLRFLLASPYVTDVIADRVYQPRAPQHATYPLLVIRKTEVDPSDDHGYLAGHVVTRYRVMAASRSYADAVNLRTALRGLAGFSLAEAQRSGRNTGFNSQNVAIQSVIQVFENDRFEEDSQLYVATMDYEVTHTELAPTGIQ